jgi:molecular chaperone GrpE
MGTPAEPSTTEENRDGVAPDPADKVTSEGTRSGGAGNPPEAAPTQPDTDAELARLEDNWRRAVADLDNLRKRYGRELDRERVTERARVAGAWLPIVDNLERALSHAGDESNAVIEGIRNVLDQAVNVLTQLGYPRDARVGVPFDPQHHEVVSMTDDSGSAPGTVVEVLRPGYGAGAQQLRPAAVVVSRRAG